MASRSLHSGQVILSMNRPGRAILLSIILSLAVANACFAAATDGYRVGFASQAVSVTSPGSEGLTLNGIVRLEGTSTLEAVWFCMKGPAGEITAFSAAVSGGRFGTEAYLRFGPGTYTIWAGPSQGTFDGTIRFTVVNSQAQDTRYLAPSAYIDSTDAGVVKQAGMLVKTGMADLEKVQAIYDWVAGNITFDSDGHSAGLNRLVPASQVLRERTGTCRDYSFLVAAMARALGIPVRVVYGQAFSRQDETGARDQVLHAWDEALVDGKWISLDATFGAGYVDGDRFVPQVSRSYFNLAAGRTHLVTTVTYH